MDRIAAALFCKKAEIDDDLLRSLKRLKIDCNARAAAQHSECR